MIDARTVDIGVAKTAGELLATSTTSDVVDALLALLAPPGDQILTSDPGDLKALRRARKVPATLVMV